MDTNTYNELIQPLVEEVAIMCKEANIPMVARIDYTDKQGHLRVNAATNRMTAKTTILLAIAKGIMPNVPDKEEDFTTTDEFKAQLNTKVQAVRAALEEYDIYGVIHIVTDGHGETFTSLDMVRVGPGAQDNLYLMGQIMTNDPDAMKNLKSYVAMQTVAALFARLGVA